MTSSVIRINLDIDIDTDLTCIVCMEIIQTADQFRQCTECNTPLCVECIRRFTGTKSEECPTCRRSKSFSKNRFIANKIYPAITVPCPYTKCEMHVIPNSGHVATCKFRPINCPICLATTNPNELHAHIQKCTIPWTYSPHSAFNTTIKAMTTGATPMGQIISLNNDDEKISDYDRRLLYVWRMSDACINIMCIQLSCTAIESKIICQLSSSTDTDNMRRIGIPIHSSDNISNIAIKTIPRGDIIEFDSFAIAPGAHSFDVGNVYTVEVEDNDWTTSRLLEIIQNPTRAVFVTCDPRRKLVVINLDGADAFKKIRPNADMSGGEESSDNALREVMSFIMGSIPHSGSSNNVQMLRGLPRYRHN